MEDLEGIAPLIKESKSLVSTIKKLDSLEGFVSEVTKSHVCTNAESIESCLDRIGSIAKKISK